MGIPPLAANVTSSVALLGSGASSALRAEPDVAGHGRTLRRWVPLTVVLSLAGRACSWSSRPAASSTGWCRSSS